MHPAPPLPLLWLSHLSRTLSLEIISMEYSDIAAFGQGSLDSIISFEEKIKIQLPRDYREFLLQCNGGEAVVDLNLEVVVNDGVIREVDVLGFYGLSVDPQFDINRQMSLDEGKIGLDYPGYIPIARGSARIVYRMCLQEAFFGNIFYDEQNFEGEISFVAKSWLDYVKMIYPMDFTELYLQGL